MWIICGCTWKKGQGDLMEATREKALVGIFVIVAAALLFGLCWR